MEYIRFCNTDKVVYITTPDGKSVACSYEDFPEIFTGMNIPDEVKDYDQLIWDGASGFLFGYLHGKREALSDSYEPFRTRVMNRVPAAIEKIARRDLGIDDKTQRDDELDRIKAHMTDIVDRLIHHRNPLWRWQHLHFFDVIKNMTTEELQAFDPEKDINWRAKEVDLLDGPRHDIPFPAKVKGEREQRPALYNKRNKE